ncbi:MAG: DUF4105 domain-containing protein [Bacteroidales bacterium]
MNSMRLFRFFPVVLQLLLLFALPCAVVAQPATDSLQVSLLTASPGSEVYEKFGHTALRVRDVSGKTDVVFNYGLFSFNTPNFIFRFVKGETDYQLGATEFAYFPMEYAMRGSRVTEQVLNISSDEAARIFRALLENYRPENRVYRYNFFFDNCSTRPRDMIANNLTDSIRYATPDSLFTFRELVYSKTDASSWLSFGIDLTLGANADRKATYAEAMFLPEILMDAFEGATIGDKPLVNKTIVVVEEDTPELHSASVLDRPVIVCWGLFILILASSVIELRRKKIVRPIDTLLFGIAGLAGCVLFFLNFISVHPAVDDNYNCIWLQPLQLFAAIAVWVKSAKRVLYYYHFANFVALLLLLLFYGVIPQHFNAAFFPLIGVLMLRSALHIILRLKNHR